LIVQAPAFVLDIRAEAQKTLRRSPAGQRSYSGPLGAKGRRRGRGTPLCVLGASARTNILLKAKVA